MGAYLDCEAHENALNSLGGESNGGDGSDLGCGKPLAMAKPKDGALFLLILAGGNRSENPVDLVELDTAADDREAVGVRYRFPLGGDSDRVGHAGSALGGHRRLEMIVDDVVGHDFQESVNGVFAEGLERAQQTAIALTELEVGVLDEVVDLRPGGFEPMTGRA